jgi:hypothetical protein
MQQLSARGGFALCSIRLRHLTSLQSERTEVVFSAMSFTCVTPACTAPPVQPREVFTETSPTVACQRADAKRTTVTQCVMPPRQYIAPTPLPDGRRVRRPADRLARWSLRRTLERLD